MGMGTVDGPSCTSKLLHNELGRSTIETMGKSTIFRLGHGFNSDLLNYQLVLVTTVPRWTKSNPCRIVVAPAPISMLPLGCALGAGGQQKSNPNAEETIFGALCNIEFWSLGFYLVGVYRV